MKTENRNSDATLIKQDFGQHTFLMHSNKTVQSLLLLGDFGLLPHVLLVRKRFPSDTKGIRSLQGGAPTLLEEGP